MKIWNYSIFMICLTPFMWLYQWIMQLRNVLYDRNILKVDQVDATVISVGNITVGGTGKTPVVEALAHLLQKQGKRVAIQSRGYGRRYPGILLVSDDKSVLATPEQAGDEPYLLARHLPGVPIIVGSDRYGAACQIVQNYKPDVLILDDAFQHRRIHRDIDIVTMDASIPWGNHRLLPAGPLREKKSGLKRADLVILTRADNPDQAKQQMHQLKTFTQAPMITAQHEPVEWIDLKTKKTHPLEFMNGRFVIAMAGIGNPESFLKTLKSLHVEPMDFIRFKDHHWYMRHDVDKIMSHATKHSAIAILTTEKDGVRMLGLTDLNLPVICLKIQCTLHDQAMLQQVLA